MQPKEIMFNALCQIKNLSNEDHMNVARAIAETSLNGPSEQVVCRVCGEKPHSGICPTLIPRRGGPIGHKKSPRKK